MLDEPWCISCGNIFEQSADGSTYCSSKCQASADLFPSRPPPPEAYKYSHRQVKARLFSGREDSRKSAAISKPRRTIPSPFGSISTSTARLNETTLKLEHVLGTQEWISTWVHDVIQHGPGVDATGHPASSIASGSGSNHHISTAMPVFSDETSDCSQILDEHEDHTPVAHTRPRPHIRSRHSCPADLSQLQPSDLSSLRPSLLMRPTLAANPVADLTATPTALLSGPTHSTLTSMLPLDRRRASISHVHHDFDAEDNLSATRFDDQDAGGLLSELLTGAVTTSSKEASDLEAASISIISVSDSQQELVSVEKLQAVLSAHTKTNDCTQSNAILQLLKGYLQPTPSLTASLSSISGFGVRPKVRLTAASQAAPRTTAQRTRTRPRAHTTSYDPLLKSSPYIPDDSQGDSPSIVTMPVDTPLDCISELNLDSKKTPTCSGENFRSFIESTKQSSAITEEELLRAIPDELTHNGLRINALSILPNAFHDERFDSKASRASARHCETSSSPVPIPPPYNFPITRGRPITRDLDYMGPSVCGRNRRVPSGRRSRQSSTKRS